jgi:hypothetical protein
LLTRFPGDRGSHQQSGNIAWPKVEGIVQGGASASQVAVPPPRPSQHGLGRLVAWR